MRPLRMINRPASNQKPKSINKKQNLFSLDCTSFSSLKHSEILIPASTQITNINSFQNRKLSYSSNNEFSQSFLSIKEANQEQPQLKKINLQINVEKMLQQKQQTIEHFKLQLQQAKYLISNLKQQNKKLLDEISVLKAAKKQELTRISNIRQELQGKFQAQRNQYRQKVKNYQDQISFLNSRRDKEKQRFSSYEQIIRMLSQKIKILEQLVQKSKQNQEEEQQQFQQQEQQELQERQRQMQQFWTNQIESVIQKVFSNNLASENEIDFSGRQKRQNGFSSNQNLTVNKLKDCSENSKPNQSSIHQIKQNHPSTPKSNSIIKIIPFNEVVDTNQQMKWTQSSINKQNNHKKILCTGEKNKNKQNLEPKGYIVESKEKYQDLPQTKRSQNCPQSSRKVSFSPYKLKQRTINQSRKNSSSSLSKQNKFQKSMDFSDIHIEEKENQSYFSKLNKQNAVSKPLFLQKGALQQKDLNCINLNSHQVTSSNRQKQDKNNRIVLNQKSPNLPACQLTDFQFQLKPTNNRFKKLDKKIYF